MDKYEYNVRVEQITKLVAEKDYKTAAKISDSIDWRRVRSVSTLTMIGEVYEEARRYEDAKEILLMAYERAPIGRRLAYRLTEVCIKGNDFKGAKKYYEDFVNLSPNDNRKYVLLYEIYKKQGVAISKRIAVLEEYVKNNVDEYWYYELACCYYEAGMNDNCIKKCDELFMWFGDGEYVVKALELKGTMMPLTDKQEAVVTAAAAVVPTAKEAAVEKEPVKEAPPVEKAKTMGRHKKKAVRKSEMPAAAVKPIEEQLEEREQNSVLAVTEETKDIRKEQEAVNESEFFAESLDDADSEHVNEEEFWKENEPEQEEKVPAAADIEEKLPDIADIEKELPDIADIEKELPDIADIEKELPDTADIEEKLPAEMVNTAEMSEISEAVVRMTDELSEDNEKGIYSESELTDEQRETFRKFLYMRGMERQLINVFQGVSEHKPDMNRSADGNIMVVGDYKSGKTTLAISVIKEVNMICKRYNRRIAKISGERLNSKGISETLSQLTDSDLLIERAGRMSKATLQGLLNFMSGETGGMRVVVEDTREGMEYIFSQVPEARTYFAYYIELREVEIADWVEIAENYCKETGFVLDDMAKLALSAKISQISKDDFTIEYEDIKKIADEAVRRYKRRHFFKRKNSENDISVLKETDFKW